MLNPRHARITRGGPSGRPFDSRLAAMRIELRPDIQSPHGVPVGTLDGDPLVYRGRIPYVAGRPYRQADIAPALAEAVDVAATSVFGSEWSTDLGKVTGLSRRTCGRDRIGQFGIPSWVLVLLGRMASHDCPRAIGYALLAVAELHDRGPYAKGSFDHSMMTAGRDRDEVETFARLSFEEAIELVFLARDERSRHRTGQDLAP